MMHRWLQVGRPDHVKGDPAPDLSPLARLPIEALGMEISRTPEGRVTYRVLAPDPHLFNMVSHALEDSLPHVTLGGEAPCAMQAIEADWHLWRALPATPHHYWPLTIPLGPDARPHDYADHLVAMLADKNLGGAEVHLQVLARRPGDWESAWYSSKYAKLVLGLQGHRENVYGDTWKVQPTSHDQEQLKAVEARRVKAPFHVEIRAIFREREGSAVPLVLGSWLDQWTTFRTGQVWRYWEEVRPKFLRKDRWARFAIATVDHDLDAFASKKEARDITSEELATMLAPPWRRGHASLAGSELQGSALGSAIAPRPRLGSPLGRRSGGDQPDDHVGRGKEKDKSGGVSPAYETRLGAQTSQARDCEGWHQDDRAEAHPEQVGASAHLDHARDIPVRHIQTSLGQTNGDCVLGTQGDRTLTLPPDWRHVGIVGATGTGKSTLLLNLVLQTLRTTTGTVVVLDPTGALVRDVKARLTPDQAGRTVEFDPSTLLSGPKGAERVSPGFNLLEIPKHVRDDPAAFDRASSVIISDLIRSFHDTWGEASVGARASYFMTAILKGLMRRPGTTLLDVRDIIVDKEARERYFRWLPPGSDFEGSFAQDELPKYRLEDFVSTLDKTGFFGSSRVLRAALCQREGAADFGQFLTNRLVLLDVSRGKVGDQNCRILGASFLSMLWSQRLSMGEGAPPLTLVIDEAQTFAIPSLAQMLSEGRKYGVRVVVANQYFGQMPKDLLSALMSNVDVWCAFRTGPDDAHLAEQVTQAYTWDQTWKAFVNLPNREFMCNVLTRSLRGHWRTVSPPPTLAAVANEKVIRTRMEALGAVDTSEGSPFLVSADTMGRVLDSIVGRPSYEQDVVSRTGVPLPSMIQAFHRARDLGYIPRVDPSRKVGLTPLGHSYVRAWRARSLTGAEGEEHLDLVARAFVYLVDRWPINGEPVKQTGGGASLPDGMFTYLGLTCNLEAECSTLRTKPAQVLKNFDKALGAGRRCLFAVPTLELAGQLIDLLKEQRPDAVKDQDYAVLAWTGEKMVLVPEDWSRRVLFEPGPTRIEDFAKVSDAVVSGSAARDAVQNIFLEVKKEGSADISLDEIHDLVPPKILEGLGPNVQAQKTQLGQIVTELGAPGRRGRRGKVRVTLYDVQGWTPKGPEGSRLTNSAKEPASSEV